MFLLDTNVLVEASRFYYSAALAPSFWNWLKQQHQAGALASIESVRDEISAGAEDHLAAWAKTLPPSFWLAPGPTSVASMATLTRWTMDPERPYTSAARHDFLSAPDYLLVAQAHAGGHEVVTREQPRPYAKKRVLIPDACAALGVPLRDPFAVYTALGLVM